MIRQFTYVHGVVEISLLSGKIQSAATVFHTLSRRRQQQQNPNHQKRFLYPAHKIHNGLQNGPLAWAYRPKSPLYGLSLRKSPIKNHTTLFQVGSGRQPDQTQLDSTKSNKIGKILMEFFTPDMDIRQSMILLIILKLRCRVLEDKNWTWWPVRYEDLVAIQSKLSLVN